jgi:dihydrofolate synthase/folylpolyglutamate synthase
MGQLVTSRQAILERLFKRTTQIKLGLERVAAASAAAGDPHKAFRACHVAGTNGKGSVCMYLDAILRQNGFRTGLFTSPHIIRFEERFCINGAPVAIDQWLSVYQDLESIIDRFDLTFFEATALICFELFKREKVAWAIIETGLGGRLDATNIITPAVAIITALGIDHAEFLGNDLPAIAAEKLGIVKPVVPLVMAAPQSQEVRRLAETVCCGNAAPCTMVDATLANAIDLQPAAIGFEYHGRQYSIPVSGDYQIVNALCALEALASIDAALLDKAPAALAAVRLPGRFQVITDNERRIVFDVGHNPQAAGVFTATLRRMHMPGPIAIVAGIMKDKDYSAMIASYCTVADSLIVTQPQTDRAATVQQLLACVPTGFGGRHHVICSVVEAVRHARETCKTVCVAGSFYTVGEAMTALGVEPFR